jgi:autotransporter-associated beta strand protein
MATQIMGEVLLKVNGTLDLNGHDQIISSLKGSGTVTNSDPASQPNSTSAVTRRLFPRYDHRQSHDPKDGPAKQRLSGKNTFTGTVTIRRGVLEINSDQAWEIPTI